MHVDRALRRAMRCIAASMVVAASSSTSLGLAQTAWETPTPTFPPGPPRPPVHSRILRSSTPPLVSGASYAIRTFDVTGDPVMTITTGADPRSTIVTGADGLAPCYPSSTSLGPACAMFVASSTAPVWAHVRAWTINTPGVATLRIRRLATPGIVPTDTNLCSAGISIPDTTCWMAISSSMESFGGTVRVGLGTAATRMHFVTRETPYVFATAFHAPHALWFVRNNGDSATRRCLPVRGCSPASPLSSDVPRARSVVSRSSASLRFDEEARP